MVLGLNPVGKPTTWEKKQRFWTETWYCMVLGLKPMGKPTTWEKQRFWTEPRHCMDLEVKPMGKSYLRKNNGFGQNQGIVWTSDSSLWGNQLPENKQRFWTEPRHCMVLGLKPVGKPITWKKKQRFSTEPRHCMALGIKPMEKPTTWEKKTKIFDRTKVLYGPRSPAYGETNYLRKNKGFG